VFITDPQLQQALADTLKRDVATLEPYWDRVVTLANLDAYTGIVGILAGRGYSAANIAGWDAGSVYQTSIGLFWCGVHGAAHFMPNEGELLAELDRREELKTLDIIVGGIIIDPTPLVETGPIGYGTMETGREVSRRFRRDATGRIVWP
jgi:hypothetical protein